MRFIEIFLPSNFNSNKFGLMISNLKAIIKLILNFEYKNLINVTEDEYNKKCNEILNKK